MKLTYLPLIAGFAIIVSSCASQSASRSGSTDDIYYSASDPSTPSSTYTTYSESSGSGTSEVQAEKEINYSENNSGSDDGYRVYSDEPQTSEKYYDEDGNEYVVNNYYYDDNDYYNDDYYYSSHINRFYDPYYGFGYYSPCYSSVYYDPWYSPGISIGFGYGWGGYYGYHPYHNHWWYSPYYAYYDPWYSPYYPYGYGYGYGGYYGSYWNGYNNGYWNGYHDGYYGGYYNNGYYGNGYNDYGYNSGNGYYYGPHNTTSSNTNTGTASAVNHDIYEGKNVKQEKDITDVVRDNTSAKNEENFANNVTKDDVQTVSTATKNETGTAKATDNTVRVIKYYKADNAATVNTNTPAATNSNPKNGYRNDSAPAGFNADNKGRDRDAVQQETNTTGRPQNYVPQNKNAERNDAVKSDKTEYKNYQGDYNRNDSYNNNSNQKSNSYEKSNHNNDTQYQKRNDSSGSKSSSGSYNNSNRSSGNSSSGTNRSSGSSSGSGTKKRN